MRAHLTETELKSFAVKAMAPELLLEVSEHVAACSACAARLNAWHAPLSWTDDDGDDGAHMSYELLERVVDGRANAADQAIVEQHVAACSICSQDLAELRQFAGTMTPASAATQVGIVARLRASLTPRQWLAFAALPVAAAVAAVLIVPTMQRKSADDQLVRATQRADARPESQAETVLADDNRTIRIAADGSVDPAAPFSESERLAIGSAIRGEVVPSTSGTSPSLPPRTGGTAYGAAGSIDPLTLAQRTHPNSHLLLGALYQQRGAWTDAEREYRLLLDANPTSAVARDLWERARWQAGLRQ